MLHCPKYSVGSTVVFEKEGTELKGIVIDLEAVLKISRYNESYKVVYLVEVEDVGVRRVMEDNIKDSKELQHVSEMDKFLADSLLLTRHKFPNEMIDNTIKELLKFDAAGGKVDGDEDLLQ